MKNYPAQAGMWIIMLILWGVIFIGLGYITYMLINGEVVWRG